MKEYSRIERAQDFIRHARLMDDSFFELCFRSNPKYIGSRNQQKFFKQLGIPLVKVNSIETQERFLTVENRNACLDAVATDVNGNLINIEVQRAKSVLYFAEQGITAH